MSVARPSRSALRTETVNLDVTGILAAIVWAPLVAALAAGATMAHAVPPPPRQLYADCDRPVYATDHLVCGEPELRALDLVYRELLDDSSHAERISPHAIWETDEAWFRRRSMCASSITHDECVRGAYESRIADRLALRRARLPGAGQRLTCDGEWRGLDVWRVDGPDGANLSDTDGTLWLGLWGRQRTAAWTPFALLAESPPTLTITPQSGGQIRCVPKP